MPLQADNTFDSFDSSVMLGGSSKNVVALLSCWKQKLMFPTIGEVFMIVIRSMFSGYRPSLYLVGVKNRYKYFI